MKDMNQEVDNQTMTVPRQYEKEVDYSAAEPVPMNQRTHGFLDLVATWVGANSNNASWYTGGTIAGATFVGAIGIAFVSNPIAYFILAIVGYMGFKIGTSTMALTRPAFGIKGSILPTILNMVSFVGWAAVNTFIPVIAMSYIFNGLFGWPSYGQPGGMKTMIWCIVFMSILNLIAVSLGRRSVKIVERVGIFFILFLGIWITIAVLKAHPISEILSWSPPSGAKVSFGVGIDLMAAFSLSWVLGIAEFTRYTRTVKSSTIAPMIGASVSLLWFIFVGVIAVIGATLDTGTFDPNNADPSTLVAKLGLGWVALVFIIVGCITTNVVNLTAGGISLTNVTKKIKPLHSIWLVTTIAGLLMLVPLFMSSFLDAFQGFLGLIGTCLSALLGILLADYFYVKKRTYDVEQFEAVGGKYWYYRGVNLTAIFAWVLGVVFHTAIQGVSFLDNSIGTIYPTIIVTGLLYSLLTVTLARKRKVTMNSNVHEG